MRRREFIAGLGGAAVARPLAALAQQRGLPKIGFLDNAKRIPRFMAAFSRGLEEQGYVEGRNVEVLYRSADDQPDRLPALAAEFVRLEVAVIVCRGLLSAEAARSTTSTLPIVFGMGVDPVKIGLVTSLNRPGGNATGITVRADELTGKRLELLHEIAPEARSIAFFLNPTNLASQAAKREAEVAARILGIRLVAVDATNDIEAGFRAVAEERIGGLLADADTSFGFQTGQLLALAARNRVPAIYINREMVEAGGLMSYGPSLSDAYRLSGNYVGRILKGEKPADLPVHQSTLIDMVLNLKTAKALGLTIPETLLATADEVIQ